MIKATIQNTPYCTEIRFSCSETELSKKLGEIGMNTENLAPVGTVIEIEPMELSMLKDCEVSLDALNFLGKRMNGMDKSELNQFLAVLTCDELVEGYGLKDVINLTYNLARYTLIEDTDDLHCRMSLRAKSPRDTGFRKTVQEKSQAAHKRRLTRQQSISDKRRCCHAMLRLGRCRRRNGAVSYRSESEPKHNG